MAEKDERQPLRAYEAEKREQQPLQVSEEEKGERTAEVVQVLTRFVETKLPARLFAHARPP